MSVVAEQFSSPTSAAQERATTTPGAGRARIRLDVAAPARGRAAAHPAPGPVAVLAAAWAAVLGRHGDSDAVAFDLARPGDGSALPVVLELAWDRPFADVAGAVPAPDPGSTGSGSPGSVVATAVLPARDPRLPASAPGGVVRLLAARGAEGWRLELDHDPRLLPGPLAAGVAASLREALVRAAEEPRRPLADLFTDAPAAARATDGHGRRPPARGLDGWLRRTAALRSDAVAVEEGGSRTSYRQLGAAVQAATAALRRLGVRPQQVVGLSTETLTETVVAMLALLRSGASYLPLPATLPTDRLARQAELAGCRLVIGEAAPAGLTLVRPDELYDVPEPRDAGRLGRPGGYVAFPAAADGPLRGVVVDEGPLLNLLGWQLEALMMTGDTRFVQLAPFGSDGSFQEIVATLAAGGTVVAGGLPAGADPAAVVARVAASRATHVLLPAAAAGAFAAAALESGADLGALCQLYVCQPDAGRPDVCRPDVCRPDAGWPDAGRPDAGRPSGRGAGPRPQPALDRLRAAYPRLRVTIGYGPPETRTALVHRPVAGPRTGPAPLGRPIAGVTAQVVDRSGHLAPVGVAGELVLGGRCPAAGYLTEPAGAPAAGAPDFEPDPLGPPGARRFRTGARAFWSVTGELHLADEPLAAP